MLTSAHHRNSLPRNAWTEERSTPFTSALHFQFRGRSGRERVDWRLLAAVDPDTVARNCDFDALQAVIENLAFADVQGEGMRTMADSNLVKLARLSQMCLEYLLFCQETLESQNKKAKDEAKKWETEVEQTRVEAKALNKRLMQMKKALRSYEHLSAARKEAGLDSHEPVDVFKCHDGKLFVTEKHALAHIQKRYPASEHEALKALLVRVPAVQRTDRGASTQADSTAKAIRDAKAEEETRRQHQVALENRVADLATANKILAEQLESLNASVRNAQHLAHQAESRTEQLEEDKAQLASSLASAHHDLELVRQQLETSEHLRSLEVLKYL